MKQLNNGSSAEKIAEDYGQLNLFNEAEMERQPISVEPKIEEITYKRKKAPKRKQREIYGDLPVEEIIYDLPAEEKFCENCKAEMSFMKPSSQDHRTADSPEGCMIGGYEVLKHPELVEPTIIKNYISSERAVPPVIMFHGSNDELVPFGQSCELYEALRTAGKDVSLYQIEGAHHGDRQFWSSTVLDMIQGFIEKYI